MRYLWLTFLFTAFIYSSSWSQGKAYKVGCIGFYNFENLFDTEDDPEKRDEDFTPDGSYNWDQKLYQEKLNQLATVVSDLGTELTPDGISILGLSEIENRKVLEDFVNHPKVRNRNFQIVHYESPDERGIDCALLYNPKYFEVISSKPIHQYIIRPDSSIDYTRDVLLVSGLFDGDLMHIMVNHWPSRGGGEAASAYERRQSAEICKAVADSLMQADPNAKVVIMGDLNDDPVSPSIKEVLDVKFKKKKVKEGDLYNPWYNFYKKGVGTLAWRDSWNLFDQVILSYGFVNPDAGGYQYYQSSIYNKNYLVQKTGQFKGYPFRTFAGGAYLGGYSDHFPVYVFLVKEL
jgi:hypothetical protein